MLVGCKSKEPIIKEVYINHIEKEILRDTIIDVQIKEMYVEKKSKDTLSELRTNNAYSRAFWSNGILFHSLEQSGVQPTNIVYKDKITIDTIYKDNTIVKEVEKELSWWGKFIRGCGYLFWIIGIVIIVYKKIKTEKVSK